MLQSGQAASLLQQLLQHHSRSICCLEIEHLGSSTCSQCHSQSFLHRYWSRTCQLAVFVQSTASTVVGSQLGQHQKMVSRDMVHVVCLLRSCKGLLSKTAMTQTRHLDKGQIPQFLLTQLTKSHYMRGTRIHGHQLLLLLLLSRHTPNTTACFLLLGKLDIHMLALCLHKS